MQTILHGRILGQSKFKMPPSGAEAGI